MLFSGNNLFWRCYVNVILIEWELYFYVCVYVGTAMLEFLRTTNIKESFIYCIAALEWYIVYQRDGLMMPDYYHFDGH